MKKKIILNLAMSIDGYIADEDGGYAWITGDGDDKLDTDNKWSHDRFLSDIDVVVMGRVCYEQNFHKDFKDKLVYVATSQEKEDYDNIRFINGDICRIVEGIKNEGKNIYLFGGGVLLDSFIKADIIDEYIIGIIPTILGQGRPLFLEKNPKIDLHLEEYTSDKGVIILDIQKGNKIKCRQISV